MLFNNSQKLTNLSCEIIEVFNRFNINDAYWILLPDKHYDSLSGWKKPKNPHDYVCNNEVLWNDSFNMIIESEVHYMFRNDPDTIHEVYGDNWKEEAKQLVRCHALLRRIFRRYNLEWRFINQGFGLTFKIKNNRNGCESLWD